MVRGPERLFRLKIGKFLNKNASATKSISKLQKKQNKEDTNMQSFPQKGGGLWGGRPPSPGDTQLLEAKGPEKNLPNHLGGGGSGGGSDPPRPPLPGHAELLSKTLTSRPSKT